MPKSNTRLLLYSLLLVFSTVIVSSAVVNNDLEKIIAGFGLPKSKVQNEDRSSDIPFEASSSVQQNAAIQPMFTTIILGADEEVGCSNNGFTVARFNLCGDSDD